MRTCICLLFLFFILNLSCQIPLQEVARPKQEFDTQSFEDVEKGRQELQVADARKQHGMPNLEPFLLACGLVSHQLPCTLSCPSNPSCITWVFCNRPWMSNLILLLWNEALMRINRM